MVNAPYPEAVLEHRRSDNTADGESTTLAAQQNRRPNEAPASAVDEVLTASGQPKTLDTGSGSGKASIQAVRVEVRMYAAFTFPALTSSPRSPMMLSETAFSDTGSLLRSQVASTSTKLIPTAIGSSVRSMLKWIWMLSVKEPLRREIGRRVDQRGDSREAP